MFPCREVNTDILNEIEKTALDPRRVAWREAIKSAPYRMYTDRQKYATISWKETAGQDLELRRARLVQKIAENVAIDILDYDFIVGRIGPGIVGNYTEIDICGDYLDGLWSEEGIQSTLHDNVRLSEEELEDLREAVRTFKNQNPVDCVNKVFEETLGEWPRDVVTARLKDPDLSSGNFGNCTNTFDFEKILRVGVKGYREEAQRHIDEYLAEMTQESEKFIFWKAAVIICDAAIAVAHRYAALAREKAAAEPDPARKAELLDIAETCEYVPENPARNFREALQSMVLVGLMKAFEHPMHNQPHWGRGDTYLYPFFKHDIESGAITAQDALNMLAEVIGRWGTQLQVQSNLHKQTHQITYGINSMNLGGIGPDGVENANELSYLFLHAVGLLHMSSPTVTVNWTSATPHWFMKKAIEVNRMTGGGIPLFENDEHMVESFVRDGVSIDEARTWIGRGCVWPALPQRSEYKGGAAGFNSAAMLDMTLHNGVAATGKMLGLETGDPRSFRTFEEFYEAYVKQHNYVMRRTLWLADIARDNQYKYLRLPALSVFSIRQCMDKGRDTMIPDIQCEYGITDRAIIDCADSLMAVKKLVYDDKVLTMDELIAALDSNFEGERGEEIRQMCLKAPKFGNGIDEVDELAGRVGQMSADSVTSWDHSPYPAFKSVREGLSWHYAAGLGVRALPNGRRAFEPLNDASCSPMRGMDKCGPTAVLQSVLTADFGRGSYVSALNQKFPKSAVASDADVEKLVAYTNAFMKAGGTHIQYNIVDSEDLKAAKKAPENYQDLIVRVGGFSAYFVQLSEGIQDDVIGRTEQVL
ncbi:MAG: hypothetical protein IIY36_08700 [Lachnospiraceae bacterium]|nr:hypothetical protein [Lachnospiraceae bacterium]